MTDSGTRDGFTSVRAEYDRKLAALGREVATLRRAGTRRGGARLPRRLLPLAFAILLAALPAGALAVNPFADLNPNSVHNANIAAIADAGITKGCDPGVAYCPNGLVTREEMASFLARTAGLGDNPPVANARTAQNAIHATAADTAQTAATLATTPASSRAYAANEIVRLATAEGDDSLAVTSAFTEMGTFQLTIPAPGLVLVDSSLSVFNFPAGENILVRFVWEDVTTGAVSFNTYVGGMASNGEQLILMASPNHVFQINTPGTHQFRLKARVDATHAVLNASQITLTGIYVPFGPTGNTPTFP